MNARQRKKSTMLRHLAQSKAVRETGRYLPGVGVLRWSPRSPTWRRKMRAMGHPVRAGGPDFALMGCGIGPETWRMWCAGKYEAGEYWPGRRLLVVPADVCNALRLTLKEFPVSVRCHPYYPYVDGGPPSRPGHPIYEMYYRGRSCGYVGSVKGWRMVGRPR